MDDRELSELSFIAHALLRAPEQFEAIAKEAAGQANASGDFKEALESLVGSFRRHRRNRTQEPDFAAIISELEQAPAESARFAARALNWARRSASPARAASR